ncbi:MAG: AI-2E family transporter [Syntrophotaleaceae bacterium]
MVNRQTGAAQILVTLAAVVLVLAGLQAAKAIVVPFLLAAFIAIISAAPMFWLQRKGLPTWLALLIVILVVLLVGSLMAGLVVTSVRDLSGSLPAYDAKLRELTMMAVAWLQNLGIKVSAPVLTELFDPGAAMKLVSTMLNALGNVVTNGFLVMMTVVFMLLEASTFPVKLGTVLGGDTSLGQLDSFISNVKHYMLIKTLISLATGVLVTVLVAVIGVDLPLLWGLLAFALNYVPNIGSIIAGLPAVLMTLVQLGPLRALMVAVGYVVLNLLMGSLLEPRFLGRELGLSTLVVFLSLLFWGWLLGPVGMLLSVPLTMTAKIALDSRDDTRWLATLLGADTP